MWDVDSLNPGGNSLPEVAAAINSTAAKFGTVDALHTFGNSEALNGEQRKALEGAGFTVHREPAAPQAVSGALGGVVRPWVGRDGNATRYPGLMLVSSDKGFGPMVLKARRAGAFVAVVTREPGGFQDPSGLDHVRLILIRTRLYLQLVRSVHLSRVRMRGIRKLGYAHTHKSTPALPLPLPLLS